MYGSPSNRRNGATAAIRSWISRLYWTRALCLYLRAYQDVDVRELPRVRRPPDDAAHRDAARAEIGRAPQLLASRLVVPAPPSASSRLRSRSSLRRSRSAGSPTRSSGSASSASPLTSIAPSCGISLAKNSGLPSDVNSVTGLIAIPKPVRVAQLPVHPRLGVGVELVRHHLTSGQHHLALYRSST